MIELLNAELETVCGLKSALPKTELPEIAIAGKSNVGKSSMINALVNRKALARTSGQPGKTQTINFYRVNTKEGSLYLVDLPGYGYASVGAGRREQWGKMIERYLNTSPSLKRILLLVDIRHDPSDNDRMMYDWIVSRGIEPVVVATKADKLKRSQLKKQVAAVREGLGLPDEVPLVPFSAETKDGREALWDILAPFLA